MRTNEFSFNMIEPNLKSSVQTVPANGKGIG